MLETEPETSLSPVGGPASWKSSEIDWQHEGLHVFTTVELREIDLALAHLKALGDIDLPAIDRASFPLQTAAATLHQLAHRIHLGRGFVMLRGLPRRRYDADDMARIYFGIGAYLGHPMVQSYQGELLGHVMDHTGLEHMPRAYHAGGHLGMHTDSCDIVGLMCLRKAMSGGASRIASAVAVHDALVASRPDMAKVLYRGFFYRRMDLDAQYGSGRVLSKTRVPVFTRSADASHQMACYFLGGYARRAAARGDVPLSTEELEAIDTMEQMAGSPEFYLDMNFADGDIQFLNNRLILHGRTDYVDALPVDQRRHLLRLWLRVPSWESLPEEQIFHTAHDHEKWLLQRAPNMELPSTYLAELSSRAVPSQPLASA